MIRELRTATLVGLGLSCSQCAVVSTAAQPSANSGERALLVSNVCRVADSSLNFSSLENVQHRYRISRADKQWKAFVSAGAPSNDGLGSPQPAQDSTAIKPIVTQGPMTLAVYVGAMVLVIGGLFWYRARQVSWMQAERERARLAERDRIARDLHDTLLQSAEGLALKVYAAAQQLPEGDPTRAFLMRSIDLAEQLTIEARQKLLGLRQHSQSRLELSQALAALGLELSADTATTFSAVKKGRVKWVAALTWDEVFSIAREAINNAFRHADAEHIEAIVTYGLSTLEIRIRDDGCGVSEEASMFALSGKPGHFGLRMMHERTEQLGAELVINTGTDRGTSVSLVVPGSVAYARPPLEWHRESATVLPRVP